MVKEGKLCHGRFVTSDHGPVGSVGTGMVKEGKLCHGRCVTSDHGPVGGCNRDGEGG